MSSSSLNSIYGLNRLRITGMNSGLDTDSIISSLMKIEQMKVDKQFKIMTQKEYKRDDIRGVRTELQNFRNEFMSSLSGMKNMLSADNFKAFKVESDDTQGRANITADVNATTGTHTLNAVEQLATAAKMTSGAASKNGQGLSGTGKTLGELSSELGEELRFDADGNVSFAINGEEFKFKASDTLQNVMNTVNASKAGVTMGYSQLTDKFTITNKKTGADAAGTQALTASDMAGGSNFLEAINVLDENGDAENYAAGQNAVAYIDGIRVERDKNDFKIDGIKYDLKKTFNTDYKTNKNSDGIQFEVKQDVDRAVDVIKGFVEGYNKLVASLTSKIQQRPDTDYLPLTDEERDTLSESELEKWETESKKGMLFNDPAVSQLLQDMRSAFFEEVEGVGLSLAAIGVAPGSAVIDEKYVGTQQDILIDEEKLRAALERNPDQVAQMFMAGDGLPKSEMKHQGLANKFIKLINNYRNNTSDIQTASLDYEIDKLDDKIETMRDRMTSQEELLYKKYAAMETALSKLQSQGNWLSGQFG